jgi:N-acetylmuramoyl-L-alanine amidase
VVLTRSDDRYVSLGARTRLANSEHADLFISIHCNAATRRDASGFETFFLSLARTDDARAVAALENGVTVLDDPADSAAVPDALSFLLADIAQNLFLTQSSAFASIVQQNLARMREDGLDRGVKQAGFYVLRGAYMPSVLVETAFISNPGEEALLASLDFRFEAARAIVAAVEEFAMGRGMEW